MGDAGRAGAVADEQIPGRREPDPKNLRGRPFQGGTDGLPDGGPTTGKQTYGEMRCGDNHGPLDSVRMPSGGGAGSGLSGLPEAILGAVPPQYADPDAPKSEGRKPNDEVTGLGPGGRA